MNLKGDEANLADEPAVEKVYREDLALQTCDKCKGLKRQALVLHSICHPHAPTWVRYEEGRCVISCSVCKGDVVELMLQEKNLRAN